ncbi:MAG: hypothetical protein AAGD05_06090 [Bacteroidota bacterium]
MKPFPSLLSDQQLIEHIIIEGNTALLAPLLERCEKIAYPYLLKHTETPNTARMLSYFALKRTLLQLPNYPTQQSLSHFVHINAQATWQDWLDQQAAFRMDIPKIAAFAQSISQKEALSNKVLESISQQLWAIIMECLPTQSTTFAAPLLKQLPTADLLQHVGPLPANDYLLLMMNVWGMVALRLATNYPDDFSMFQKEPNCTKGNKKFVQLVRCSTKSIGRRTKDCEVMKDLRKYWRKVGKKIKRTEEIFMD